MEEIEGKVWLKDQAELAIAAQTPPLMQTPNRDFGTHRAVASTRPFFFDEIALPLEKRSLLGVEITREGVDRVRRHLARLDPYPPNDRMVDRLERILRGALAFSEYDARFYSHELRELERFEVAGWPMERPPRQVLERLWNNEHTATLEEYGFHEEKQPLYHPETLDDDS